MSIKQNFADMTKAELEKAIQTMRSTLYHSGRLDDDTRVMITDVLIQAKAELKNRTEQAEIVKRSQRMMQEQIDAMTPDECETFHRIWVD